MHTSNLHERITSSLPANARGARLEVDVATARIAPHNPMTEHGFVHIYDPLEGTIEEKRIAELVARLPQHNQVVRVFTDDPDAIRAIHDATEQALSA